jgi:D-beta-D-heptose 7-phosphate kinase/D-beta-D-heptose 1-phosphate adenosyltransferase
MAKTAEKIRSLHEIKQIRISLREQGKSLVFTNGCFDLMHVGHVRYLEAAAGLGDFLLVAVNSDSSVRTLKGPSRPLNPEIWRAEVVAALEFVDAVIIFVEETPLALIKALEPDVLVKGSDWALEEIVGRREVESSGGRVVRIPLVEGVSTSSLIERIQAER